MLVADSFLIEWQVPFRNCIWLMTADQRLAPSNKISRAVERAKVLVEPRRRKLRQCRHERAKMPPHYYSTLAPSIFAEWGLIKANTRRGVLRGRIKSNHQAFAGDDDSRPTARSRALV